MGKDKREWRKLVKKLRRSRIRKSKAEDVSKMPQGKNHAPLIVAGQAVDESGADEDPLEISEQQRWHALEEEAWRERERQSNIMFKVKKAKAEEFANSLAAEKERIRIEWEERQRNESVKMAGIARSAKEKQEKQVMTHENEEFNQLLEFLSGDIDTPPLPYLMPESYGPEEEPCLYFSRTGSCRFYQRCRKPHPSPTLSSTILIPNFFSHFSLEQSPSDDTDAGLEYEDSELYKEFLIFYDDVLPEFRKSGSVIQFKVCRNFELHLRGNVYVQYKNIREAVEVYRKFNARFYNGKQLTLRFVKLESWRSAICGQFNRGVCLKGKSCNYMHVFRNPTREFISADHDWENPTPFRTPPNPSRRNSHPPSVVPWPNSRSNLGISKRPQEGNSSSEKSSRARSSSRSGSRERSSSIKNRHLTSKEMPHSRTRDQGHSSRRDAQRRRSKSSSRRKHSKRRASSHGNSDTGSCSRETSKRLKKHKKHKKKKSTR